MMSRSTYDMAHRALADALVTLDVVREMQAASRQERSDTGKDKSMSRRGGHNRTPLEIEQQIIERYAQGSDAVTLSAEFGISTTGIYQILERYHISRRSNIDIFRKLTPAQELAVITDYQDGIPTVKIAQRYDVNTQTIYNIMERHGIKRRHKEAIPRTYPLDVHAFDVIDTEGKAYWLGFIAADGCVTNNTLKIGLHQRDIPHLQKFTAWISPDKPIRISVNNLGKPLATVEIYSQHLCETLGEYGIVPRKTYILKSLPVLRHDLMRHFLRGYFDGDGYILQSRKTIGVGTYNREMAASIQTWLIQELYVRPVQLI